MQRPLFLLAGTAGPAAAGVACAQASQKSKVTIAVGGENLPCYLPLTIAESPGCFEDKGLDLTIVDFAGGSRALQAVIGGSADVGWGDLSPLGCGQNASACRCVPAAEVTRALADT